MNTTTLIVIVVAVVALIAAAAFVFIRERRSRALRSRFGPEYRRAVDEMGNRRHAEAELRERERQVQRLELRTLTRAEADTFTRDWRSVQSRFVDEPGLAIRRADQLITDLMVARGYPMADFEQRAEVLSVDHATLVHNYRVAHAVAARHADGEASTEDLRQAMIHYRNLFDELIEEGPVEHRKAS